MVTRTGIPIKDGNGWVSDWIGKDGNRRRVWAKSRWESWTQYDPEIDDRNAVPVKWRRRLSE